KSNRAALAIWNARSAVREGLLGEVPAHLRDAHYSGASKIGHGDGYQYPHDHEAGIALGGWVDQTYLPPELTGKRWYEPSDHGNEARVAARLAERRRAGKPADGAG